MVSHLRKEHKMTYNLIKWDAYANYKILAMNKTKEECEQIRDTQPEDKVWHEYEIVPYTLY